MTSRTPGPVAQMTVEDLKQRLDRGEPLTLLDVREDDERAYCSIAAPGLHVPMGQVGECLEEIKKEMGTGPLVVYCHHGMRSMRVAAWLGQQGVGPIFNLQGGIDAWSSRIDPSIRRY